MSPETDDLPLVIRTPSLHLAFSISCPSLLLHLQVQGALDPPGSSGWCTARLGGWGAAGSPAALSETSLRPPDQLPPLCPGSWRYSELHHMIYPHKIAANIMEKVPPRASGPSQKQKPDPPAPYDLSTSGDVLHPHWHLTIHPIFKITHRCKFSLPLPSLPSGRAKNQPQTSIAV